MTRYHGITDNTYGEILIDSGAVYQDFTDIDNPGTLLGATRGGVTFSRKPKYADLNYEGVPGKVKGALHLLRVEVSLELTLIALTDLNIAKAIPNSDSSTSSGYTMITEEEWDADTVHVLDNIALVGQRANGGGPIIIILENPICESDFGLFFRDKNEVTSKWKFYAYYDPSTLTPPWSVQIPSSSLIINMFVATAQTGANNAYSSDGSAWTTGTFPASGNWKALATGKGLFVCARRGSTQAVYSSDGVNWTAVVIPSSGNWEAATFGNGVFVMVVAGTTTAAYSSDGVNWSTTTMPFSFSYGVGYGVDRFVCVGSSKSAYSLDGITWVNVTIWTGTWLNVAYGAGKFVVVGTSANICYSTDATAWTYGSNALPGAYNWYGLVFANSLFVAVAFNSNVAAYSSDGLNWTSATLPATLNWYSVTYKEGFGFLAVASGSTTTAVSTDGITWVTGGSLPSAASWQRVLYG